jgi:hypothetical protein
VTTFVQVFDDRTTAIKGCGRACPDMNPLTLPVIPVLPMSPLEMMRANPEVVIEPEWLAAMEADATIH